MMWGIWAWDPAEGRWIIAARNLEERLASESLLLHVFAPPGYTWEIVKVTTGEVRVRRSNGELRMFLRNDIPPPLP